jgi:hypothetical protein
VREEGRKIQGPRGPQEQNAMRVGARGLNLRSSVGKGGEARDTGD